MQSTNLVWMDLEMTGLDAQMDRILEIAVLVTDGDLNVLAEGPDLILHQDSSLLDGMDDWNREHHGQSGLIDRVRISEVDEARAQQQILDFLHQHCPPKACPLAGNSVHQDRRFLRRYLPEVDAFLHYRIVDVSTVKELARRWYPSRFETFAGKKETHRALADIHESLDELRFWRSHIFREGPVEGIRGGGS